MVLPTPFERLLHEISKLANSDPAAAFARLGELYGKSASGLEVQQVSGFSIHLGAGALARFDETAAFQRTLLGHPALSGEGDHPGPVARSIWRGLAVILRLAGRTAEAEGAALIGATAPAERCRLAVMTAQLLCLRGRGLEATPFIDSAMQISRDLPMDDEVMAQVGLVAGVALRAGEALVRQAHALHLAAAALARAAYDRHPDWRARHQGLYHQGLAWLACGSPARALAAVQGMMEVEDANQAGALERFLTANLACRAQAVRGQPKIAAAALEACSDFAGRIADAAMGAQARQALADTRRFIDEQTA